jgi:hypothetical protein
VVGFWKILETVKDEIYGFWKILENVKDKVYCLLLMEKMSNFWGMGTNRGKEGSERASGAHMD